MNSLTISGVNGYLDENGTAHLRLEDVARGLGFTQIKGGIEYVRWETVNGYLIDLKFSQEVGKEYIPENIFYRLAMKAKNETAEKFTGLTDKNGVKIFEGDFVKYTNSIDEIYHEEIGLCVFEQAESNFCLQRTARNPANYPVPTTTHTVYLISNVDYEASYEVIGNIHDNPELPEV